MIRRLLVYLLLLWPQVATARWLRAESASFVGYSRGSEAALRQRLTELQRFDALLRLLTGVTPSASTARLPVYVVDTGDFHVLGESGRRLSGFYTVSPGGIAAFVTGSNVAGGDIVLLHEYTHHFMFEASGAAYPAWYVEGFAEYMATAVLGAKDTEFGEVEPGRGRDLVQGSWLPMRKVMTARIADLRADDLPLFYAQGWLTVHYMLRDADRNRRLREYLRAINAGKPAEAAFETAFGFGYDELGKRLHRYIGSRDITKTRMNRPITASDAAATVTTLPPAADALLLPGVRLGMLAFDGSARAATGDNADLLAAIRKGAARYPDDRFAQDVLAEAEVKLGDRAAGIAALDTQLTARPNDPQLLYVRAMTLIVDAEAAARAGAPTPEAMHRARVMLTRANAARPDDYRILAAHARTEPLGKFGDRELDVLLRAVELAPQVSYNAMLAARALIARGDRDRARSLLTPIANNPHGGAMADRAGHILARLGSSGPLPDLPASDTDQAPAG